MNIIARRHSDAVFLVVAVLLVGRGGLRLQLSLGWGVLVAAFAVVLVAVGHTSGLAIGALGLFAAWQSVAAIRQGAGAAT